MPHRGAASADPPGFASPELLRSLGQLVRGLAALGRDAAARDTQVTRLLWLPGEEASTCPADCLDFHTLAATDLAAHPCPEPDFDRDHLLQIVYTSGTPRPKAISECESW